MRITKSQKVIIDLMREGSTWDEGSLWICSSELEFLTGRSQQSINRSLNTLINNGMVDRKIESGERTMPNTWSYVYMLKGGF